jgi:hypothetical protein
MICSSFILLKLPHQLKMGNCYKRFSKFFFIDRQTDKSLKLHTERRNWSSNSNDNVRPYNFDIFVSKCRICEQDFLS